MELATATFMCSWRETTKRLTRPWISKRYLKSYLSHDGPEPVIIYRVNVVGIVLNHANPEIDSLGVIITFGNEDAFLISCLQEGGPLALALLGEGDDRATRLLLFTGGVPHL